MLMQSNIAGQVVERQRVVMFRGRFDVRFFRLILRRRVGYRFWLRSWFMLGAIAVCRQDWFVIGEFCAGLVYDGDAGEVTDTRYWPATKSVNVHVAVAAVLSFFSALLAN